MKANELMIGDWVFNKNTNKPMQVYPMMFSQMFRQRPDATTEDYNIFPIPLTSEILEKNGFKPYEDDMESFHSDDCVFLKQSEGGYGVCLDGKLTISGRIKYVHQLQHALRLSGIDKDIIIKKEDKL